MITWIRSAAIAPGKVTDAFTFVKKASKLIEENYAIRITVSRPLAGNPTRIFWYAQHDDLAAYEHDHQTINNDAAFLQMLGEANSCFIAGSTHDEILQTI
jgi:hypothetical protein